MTELKLLLELDINIEISEGSRILGRKLELKVDPVDGGPPKNVGGGGLLFHIEFPAEGSDRSVWLKYVDLG